MSTVTKHYCDIQNCKKEVTNNDSINVAIELKYPTEKFMIKGSRRSEYWSGDICLKCGEKLGIIRKVIENDGIVNETLLSTPQELYNMIAKIVLETTPFDRQ